MNTLIFEDVDGNGLQYTINNSDDIDEWSFTGFLEYMKFSPSQAIDQGFLFSVDDHLKHERFRFLVNNPEATMNRPLAFMQNGNKIETGDQFTLSESSQLIEVSRKPAIPPANLSPNISLKDRHHSVFHLYEDMLTNAIDQTVNGGLTTDQSRTSVSTIIESARDGRGNPAASILRYLLRAATAIHKAPFENWSKFKEAIPFRNGYEMWLNYVNGGGGVCSEKTASLKFLCDIIGLESRPVIGTQSKLSAENIESLGDYYLSNGNEPLPFDIKHLLLEVDVNEETYLIDMTGGNVPLIFLNEKDAEVYFKKGYSVRMVSQTDMLFLHRVPQWIGDAHLLVCEYHLSDAHFDLAFDQDLGLEISETQYVAAYFDYGGESSNRMRNHYEKLGISQKLDPPIFINEQTSHIPATDHSLDFFKDARTSILHSYHDPSYTGDVTIVVQPLRNNFWRKPMISRNLLPILKEPLNLSPE